MTTEETENLSQNYFNAFRAYKDTEIQEAADDYANTGEYFPPKPVQILSLVKNADRGKHTRELIERYTCSMCHQKVSAITEGICLDCAGIPQVHYESPKLAESEKPNYRIESRMRCNRCGHIGMCIKEPADENGFWQCRECYTGLSNEEITARFAKLAEMMGAKHEKSHL